MTRNLMIKAFFTLRAAGSSTSGRRRRDRSPGLENLEGRLSLSSVSVGSKMAPADLNPQPLPPGVAHVEPMIQGGHISTNIIAIL
jgi:hypothetical protein